MSRGTGRAALIEINCVATNRQPDAVRYSPCVSRVLEAGSGRLMQIKATSSHGANCAATTNRLRKDARVMRLMLLATIAVLGLVAGTGYAADTRDCVSQPRAGMPRTPADTAPANGQARSETGEPRALAQSGRPIPDYPIPPTVDVAANSCAEP
jgi:hypothetical protein